ncbi:hypothetical protein B0H12DRAFT_1304739, partial [Mycena haematopus]
YLYLLDSSWPPRYAPAEEYAGWCQALRAVLRRCSRRSCSNWEREQNGPTLAPSEPGIPSSSGSSHIWSPASLLLLSVQTRPSWSSCLLSMLKKIRRRRYFPSGSIFFEICVLFFCLIHCRHPKLLPLLIFTNVPRRFPRTHISHMRLGRLSRHWASHMSRSYQEALMTGRCEGIATVLLFSHDADDSDSDSDAGSDSLYDLDLHEIPLPHVTVHFPGAAEGGSGAPTLQMRFSGLEMPSPAVIAESVKARPYGLRDFLKIVVQNHVANWVSIARSSRYAPSIEPSFAFDPVPGREPMPLSQVPNTSTTPAYPEFIHERNAAPSPRWQTRPRLLRTPNTAPPTSTRARAGPRTRAHHVGLQHAQRKPPHRARARGAVPRPRYPAHSAPARASPHPSRVPLFPQRDEPPWMRYAQGRTEYAATLSPEVDGGPVYLYARDGPVSSPERIPHRYADAVPYAPAVAAPYSPPRMNDAYSPPNSNAYSNVYFPPTQE